MFYLCKCLKCKKKKSKIPKINIETNKIASYVQKEYGLRVYLNVYHLTFFNYILQFFGFGLFHTCLEISDNEYSFKSGVSDESGIFKNNFKEGFEKIFLKEKIYLGNTPYDINSVNEIFKLYIPFWQGNSYNLFQKNCNDFSKFFAGILLRTDYVINYPDYVNRITVFAKYFSMFAHPIKKLLSGENQDNSSTDNSTNRNIEINTNQNHNFNNTNLKNLYKNFNQESEENKNIVKNKNKKKIEKNSINNNDENNKEINNTENLAESKNELNKEKKDNVG